MVLVYRVKNVIAALRARDEAQIQEENRKVAAQAKREKRKAEILQEEAVKQAARKIRAAKKGQKKRPSCRD